MHITGIELLDVRVSEASVGESGGKPPRAQLIIAGAPARNYERCHTDADDPGLLSHLIDLLWLDCWIC